MRFRTSNMKERLGCVWVKKKRKQFGMGNEWFGLPLIKKI